MEAKYNKEKEKLRKILERLDKETVVERAEIKAKANQKINFLNRKYQDKAAELEAEAERLRNQILQHRVGKGINDK